MTSPDAYDGVGTKKDAKKSLMWIYLASKGDSDYLDLYKELSKESTKSDVEMAIKLAEECLTNKFDNCQ